ncbi:SDR family oxidoreductase [soil metagenome]
MRRVLIVGCGYLGAATAQLFWQRGWQVEGWVSSAESARALAHQPFTVRGVRITDAAAVAAAAAPFDLVIQSVSSRGGDADAYRRLYFWGAQNLAAAFSQSASLFVSSTSVYAQTGGEWVDESSPAEPTREMARVLRETEDFVLSRGGIVVRLAGIYGPGRCALVRKFLDGTATLDATDRFLNTVHRDDASEALFLLGSAARPDLVEPLIFNVCDNRPMTQRECYASLAEHFGRAMPPTTAAPAERKRGNSNKRVSSEKLLALGWRPRFLDFATGVRESVIPALDAGDV